MQGRVEGQVPDLKYLANPSSQRHRPFVTATPFPVRRHDWRGCEIPTMVKIVVEILLREELAYGRAIGAPREGPHVVHEEAQGPGTFNDEYGGGGPRAPLPRPQDILGGRWKLEDGTRTQEHRTRSVWREEC